MTSGQGGHRSHHATQLGKSTQSPDRRITAGGFPADVIEQLMAVVGTHRHFSIGAAAGGALSLLRDQFLDHGNHVEVAIEMRSFVEAIRSSSRRVLRRWTKLMREANSRAIAGSSLSALDTERARAEGHAVRWRPGLRQQPAHVTGGGEHTRQPQQWARRIIGMAAQEHAGLVGGFGDRAMKVEKFARNPSASMSA